MATKDKEEKVKGPKRINRRGLFAKDLGPMMYGFGDDNPANDTINVMEEILIDYISDVCLQAQKVSTNKGKVKVDDFRYALRKHPKKLARVEELLYMNQEIQRAKDMGKENDLAAFAGEELNAKKKRRTK